MTEPAGRRADPEPDERRWLVPLPPDAAPPLEVFVSGVPQRRGRDYELERRDGVGVLAFTRPLVTEGRLGFWRWALMFFSIAGTYRRNDSVDVRYEAAGRPRVATGLRIVAPKTAGRGDPATAGSDPARG